MVIFVALKTLSATSQVFGARKLFDFWRLFHWTVWDMFWSPDYCVRHVTVNPPSMKTTITNIKIVSNIKIGISMNIIFFNIIWSPFPNTHQYSCRSHTLPVCIRKVRHIGSSKSTSPDAMTDPAQRPVNIASVCLALTAINHRFSQVMLVSYC